MCNKRRDNTLSPQTPALRWFQDTGIRTLASGSSRLPGYTLSQQPLDGWKGSYRNKIGRTPNLTQCSSTNIAPVSFLHCPFVLSLHCPGTDKEHPWSAAAAASAAAAVARIQPSMAHCLYTTRYTEQNSRHCWIASIYFLFLIRVLTLPPLCAKSHAYRTHARLFSRTKGCWPADDYRHWENTA